MNDPFATVAGLPGVPDAVARARESVDRLRGHRILRRRGPEVSAESALRGARASAELEGVAVPLEDLRAGDARDPIVQDPIVQGALRASAELGSLASAWRTAPLQALARAHTLVAAGGVDPDALGRPRTTAAPVPPAHPSGGGVDPLGLGTPPPPEQVASRLGTLRDVLTAPTDAPAVVVAAIAHGELLTLRPFGWGDGVVARIAARVTLVDRGLDPKSLTAPEVGHVELRAEYEESIRGYASGSPDGVARWVCHCAEAIVLGARDALAVAEALLRG